MTAEDSKENAKSSLNNCLFYSRPWLPCKRVSGDLNTFLSIGTIFSGSHFCLN
jgi:hypothetical protein